MNKPFIIKKVYAYVAIDPVDGDEGIIGLPIPGNTLSLPAIGADETRLRELYPYVKHVCQLKKIKFRVIELSTRKDVTDQVKEKYEKS